MTQLPTGRLMWALGATLIIGFSVTLAFMIRPLPVSDWAYYWEAARGTMAYERGGVLIFVLRLLQALALQPYAAALTMNLFSALAILALAHRANARRASMAVVLVSAYLLAITPYYSVVQFDLAATALLCAGIWFLAADQRHRKRAWTITIAVVLVASAVSSRPQFLLVLLVFGVLLALVTLLVSRGRGVQRHRAVVSATALVAAALLGFALDSALRAGAGRAEAVRTNSGVTLYAGLLSSETSPPTCGHWSKRAMRDALADAKFPLVRAVSARLKEQPPEHWIAVIRCKMPGIFLPDAYALSWSIGAPSVVERLQATEGSQRLNAWIPHLYRIEHLSYRVLLVLIYAFTLTVVVHRAKHRQWISALVPVLWVLSYWVVHSIFEIQARYFLSLFLVLLFTATPVTAGLVTQAGGRNQRV